MQIFIGPFLVGDEITAADAALFPTMVFCDLILPKYFGWKGLWDTRYVERRDQGLPRP